jgi:anti-sigma B factor antagonist
MPVFSLDLDRSGTVPRILLRGEVDLAAKPAFDAALAAAHRRREPVVVDLSETTFMDSTGVAVLVNATAAAREDGWDFRVAPRFSFPAAAILELTGALERLPLAAA